MNKNDYHQILFQDNLKSSAIRLGLGGSWVFQQKRCRGMANQARFTVGFWLNWPVQSPNLNPIETCGLKKQLGAKKLANLVKLHLKSVKGVVKTFSAFHSSHLGAKVSL